MGILRDAGYHTADIGKQHFGDTNIDRGYDYEDIVDEHAPILNNSDVSSYSTFVKENGFSSRNELMIADGKVRLTTTKNEDGGYTFEYTVTPGELISMFTSGKLKETTIFEVVDGRPRTLDYTLLNTVGSKPRNGHVTFDWSDNSVKGDYKNQVIDIPMPENAVDRAMLQLVLMADLKNSNLKKQ